MNTAGAADELANELDRVLVLEMVRVTEKAAIAASKLIGRGDEKAADAAAVEAMRRAFDKLYIDGTVVIGEGERDEAPMLYIGEKVGGAPGKINLYVGREPVRFNIPEAEAVESLVDLIREHDKWVEPIGEPISA